MKVYYYDLYVEVDKLGGNLVGKGWQAINLKFGLPVDSEALEREYNANIKAYALFLSQNNIKKMNFSNTQETATTSSSSSGSSLESAIAEEGESDNCLLCNKNDNPSETLLCDNCDNPFHMKCLEPKLTTIPSGLWYCDKCLIGTGEYGFKEDVNKKYNLTEFYEMCQSFDREFLEIYNQGEPLSIDDIERKFWEFVEEEKSDLEVQYGADIHNLIPGEISGFPMSNTPGLPLNDLYNDFYINHPFNLTKLPFSRGSLMRYINTSISGMTIPWIYIGTLLSTFCWHVEDHYTLSINYCHFGATKKWYGIPASQAVAFEKIMKNAAPDLFQRQPDLLHQLVTLMSPSKLVERGIKCVYADQNPNEFIITYPKVYHSGFNCGFNFNEAVNFTIEPWLEYGEQAIVDYRDIKKENVFNHYQLLENILRQWLNDRSGFSKEFISKCVKQFAKFHSEQLNIIWDLRPSSYSIEYNMRGFKKRIFADEQNGQFADAEDIEMLCDSCKTHLAYQYFNVPNADKNFGIKMEEFKEAVAAEAKGEMASNIVKSEATTASKWSLPTPKSSPQDRSIKTPDSDLHQLQQSDSNRRMSLITNNLEESKELSPKLSEEEEFNILISSAKKRPSDASKETSETSKRRRSTRIQKQEQTEIASIGSSKKILQMSNEKLQLNLCTTCIRAYNRELPIGTKLIYESNPEELQRLVSTVDHELRKM